MMRNAWPMPFRDSTPISISNYGSAPTGGDRSSHVRDVSQRAGVDPHLRGRGVVVNDEPLVYVVVLNYRNYSDTIECVRTLQRASYSNFKIIIVENGSDDNSEQVLQAEFPELEIIQTGRNLGYSGGNNVGLRRALEEGAEFALILNNDTLVAGGFLSVLVEHAQSDPSAGVLGSLILNPDGTASRTCARRRPPLGEIFWNHGPGRWFGLHKGWQRASYYDDIDALDRPLEVDVVSGACMMLRTALLRQIGLLDDRSFLFLEEFILAEKLKETDFRTVLVPASRVVHKGGGSIQTVRIRQAFYFMQSLNLYLGEYRGVGRLKRYFVMTGPALFFIPGILKTISGLRRLRS